MSLSSALSTSVSALQAQSAAIASVAGNLANSETTGYKASSTSFASLVDGTTTTASGGSAGVVYSTSTSVDVQGLIESAESSTDLAIDGDGFFIVSDDGSTDEVYYTRAGDFSVDDEGLMVNSSGYYLMGYQLDQNGDPVNGSEPTTTNALTTIDLDSISGTAAATENLSIQANLPADAEVGDSFSLEVEIFDSLGVSHTVDTTYTKTAENTWELSVSDPTETGETSSSGTVSSSTIEISFNDDGSLASTTPDPATIDITGFSSGAADASISLDLGTSGDTDGLSQYSSEEDDPDITLHSMEQDGYIYGELSGVSIDEDGVITAEFDNGTSRPIYAITLADFANVNGLQSESGTVFSATVDSGSVTLNSPGEGGNGSISSYSLEASTVDTTDEYAAMIVAQQAYEAAAQVMTVSDEMFDTLNQSV